MKKVLAVVVALFAAVVFAVPASANGFYGGWFFKNGSGPEILVLGDASNSTGRYLSGTPHACGQYGSSYSAMRSALKNEGGWVIWYVDQECGDKYVRVCIISQGRHYCSTYMNHGWIRYYSQ